MSDPERFPSLAAWSALSQQQRLDVTRLAKRGRRHPDPAVAQAAHAWAEVLLVDVAVQHEERWLRCATWLPSFLTALDSGILDWLERRADRRWAQRVVVARADAGFEEGLRRLAGFTTWLSTELASCASIETGTVGPFLSVWLEPLRPEALGVGWLQCDVAVILSAGSGGRWELEPTEQDMALLEGVVCSVIAGRVTQTKGRHRSRVEVTLSDGTVEASATYHGLRGWWSRGTGAAAREVYLPYQ